MEFNVLPYVGAGPLRLGMSQNQIRSAMGVPHTTFLKSADSGLPTDSFLMDSVHVYYKKGDVCEAIEFYSPSVVILSSINILGIPYSKAKAAVLALNPSIHEDGTGFTSEPLGMGVYAPGCKDDSEASTESVIVFEKDYYS